MSESIPPTGPEVPYSEFVPSDRFNWVVFRQAAYAVVDPEGDPGEGSVLEPGDPIFLEIEDWTIKSGIEPDINTATVSYLEFDKFKGKPGVTGRVEFWFSKPFDEAGQADHVLEKISILDVEVVNVGVPDGQMQTRPVEYRLFMADRRHLFVKPRGGHLRQGLVNPKAGSYSVYTDNVPGWLATWDGPHTQELRRNPDLTSEDLVKMCLEAMGLKDDNIAVPSHVRSWPAETDLQWRGNHAPTELKRILDRTRTVFVLKSDGQITLEAIGQGDLPEIPADRKLPEIELPGIDRRGSGIIFTSDPLPVIETVQATLGSNTSDGVVNGRPNMAFVGTDPLTFSYIQLEALSPTHDPAADVRAKFQTLLLGDQADADREWYRKLAVTDVASAILSRVYNLSKIDYVSHGEIKVRAKRAVRGDDGIWSNSTSFVDCTPIELLTNVIVTSERLGKVKQPTPDFESQFTPLEGGELTVSYSRQATVEDPVTHLRVPEYYSVGYVQELGRIRRMTADELQAALDAGDVPIVSDPSYQLYRTIDRTVNSAGTSVETVTEYNKSHLDNHTIEIAPKFINESGVEGAGLPKRMAAVGFFRMELSGSVAQIRISQRSAMTEASVRTWFLPHATYLVKTDSKGGGAFPSQSQVTPALSADNAPGSDLPVVPLRPAPPQSNKPTGYFIGDLTSDGGAAWDDTLGHATWTYKISFAGNVVGQTQTPARQRQLFAVPTPAVAGWCKWNGDGTAGLIEPWEVYGEVPCQVAS